MLLCAVLLLAAAASGQGLALERVTPLDPREAGISAVEADGKAAVLVAGDLRIVLSRPVAHWEVGSLPGGRWIVLAGGVAAGLDVYLVDPRTREVGLPFQTSGGLRLPARFGDGLGSWPLAEAPHLLMFAVERGRDCVFRAVDFSDQVPRELASIVVPLGVAGFEVDYDEATQLVHVGFGEDHGGLDFLHPLAPRLVVEPRAVELSDREPGRITLRNAGRRPLPLDITVEGGGFSVVPTGRRVVAPEATDVVEVTFDGAETARGTLRIESPVAGASASISLSATARPATVDAADSAETSASFGSGSRAPLPALELETFHVQRLDATRVLLSGELTLDSTAVPDAALPVELLVENRAIRKRWKVRADRTTDLRVWVDAAAGEALHLALADDRGPAAWVSLPPLRPRLEIGLDEAVVRAAPSGPFVLIEVEPDPSGREPRRVLRSWSGRTDATGTSTIALGSIPRGEASIWLAVAEPDRAGTRLVYSELVAW